LTVAIEVREMRDLRLHGGVLIDCINGEGLERSILGNSLVKQLNMEIVAAVESDSFPAISSIIQSAPNFPMRIYANMHVKVAVIMSDFIPDKDVLKPLARSLLGWAQSRSIAFVITSCAVKSEDMFDDLGVVCSTPNAKLRASFSRMDLLDNITVSGLPAVLLNEGSWNNAEVILLVAKPNKDSVPAEGIVMQGIDVLLPEIKVSLDSAKTMGTENSDVKLRSKTVAEPEG
jgi:predicted ATP-grasp superfamily ATP-dependent carboligase